MTGPEKSPPSHQEITTLTAEIVVAYVGHNTVASNDVPDLIATVGKELADLGQTADEPEEEKLTPAVPIKRSVTPDHIICLEDGKKSRCPEGLIVKSGRHAPGKRGRVSSPIRRKRAQVVVTLSPFLRLTT